MFRCNVKSALCFCGCKYLTPIAFKVINSELFLNFIYSTKTPTQHEKAQSLSRHQRKCHYRRKACLRHSDLRPLESISEPSAGPFHLVALWPCCGTQARGPRQKSWRDAGRIPLRFLESPCWECLQNEECVRIPPSPRQPNPAKKYI